MEIVKLDKSHWAIKEGEKVLSPAFTLKQLEEVSKLATKTVMDYIAGEAHLNDYK